MAGDNNSTVVVPNEINSLNSDSNENVLLNANNQVFPSEAIGQNLREIIIQSNQVESSSDSDNNTDKTTHSDSIGIADSNVSSIENDTALHAVSNKTPTRLTVEILPGKRKGSEIYYVEQELQFYRKKKKLANGKMSAVCSHEGCNKRIHVDEVNKIAIGDATVHKHSPKKNEYKQRKVINAMKVECANIDIISACERKTSVVKSIFNKQVEE